MPHPAGYDRRRAAMPAVTAFLVYRDDTGQQRTLPLDPTADRVRIGRSEAAEVRLAWDRQISRVHAELEALGDGWAVIDDGLSANGTFVNGERLHGRRRLVGDDEIRVGETTLTFRALGEHDSSTLIPTLDGPAVELSPTQRRVLLALCRPYGAGHGHPAPASNPQIAGEVSLSVDAVKAHLRVLFGKFAISTLPQNQKRARLVELAFERGLVSRHEL